MVGIGRVLRGGRSFSLLPSTNLDNAKNDDSEKRKERDNIGKLHAHHLQYVIMAGEPSALSLSVRVVRKYDFVKAFLHKNGKIAEGATKISNDPAALCRRDVFYKPRTERAARRALSVSWRCQAWFLGDQRKPLAFKAARSSGSGMESNTICSRFCAVLRTIWPEASAGAA